MPIDDVNAVDPNAANQTSNLTSNLTQSSSTAINTQNITKQNSTNSTLNSTVKQVSTKSGTADTPVSYTYYVKVPYKIKVRVAYYKSYKLKVKSSSKKEVLLER